MSLVHAFVSDFDGTLYQHQRMPPISTDDIDAIRAYRRAGGRFGISSARPFNAIRLQTHDEVAFDFCLAVGGAVVTDAAGTVLFSQRMPFDVVSWIQGTYGHDAAAVVIAAGSDFYSVGNRHNPLIRDISHLGCLPRDLYGVSIAVGTTSRAAAIAEHMNREFAGVAHATQNGSGVDVVAHGVSKASALAKAKGMWGIDFLGAIGDADNDCLLLRSADVAYTLPDAMPAVSSLSDAVVSDVAMALGDFADRVNTVERTL